MTEKEAIAAIYDAMDVLDKHLNDGFMRIDIEREGKDDVVIIKTELMSSLLQFQQAYLDSLKTDEQREEEQEEILQALMSSDFPTLH